MFALIQYALESSVTIKKYLRFVLAHGSGGTRSRVPCGHAVVADRVPVTQRVTQHKTGSARVYLISPYKATCIQSCRPHSGGLNQPNDFPKALSLNSTIRRSFQSLSVNNIKLCGLNSCMSSGNKSYSNYTTVA